MGHGIPGDQRLQLGRGSRVRGGAPLRAALSGSHASDISYLEVGEFWLILLSSLLYLLLSPLAQWCARRWSLDFRQTRRTPRDKLDWLGLDWIALDSISIALDCVVYELAGIELAMDWIVFHWIGLGWILIGLDWIELETDWLAWIGYGLDFFRLSE